MWTAVSRGLPALRASGRALVISLALALLGVAAARASEPGDYSKLPARSSPAWVRQGIIYEIFPRQFSTTGDFAGITAQLDRLRQLGVNILPLQSKRAVAEAILDAVERSLGR